MKKRAQTLFLISALTTSLLILPVIPMLKTPAAGQGVSKVQQVTLPRGKLRTVDDMLVDQATAPFPNVRGGAVPFLPGMDPAQYAAAKAAAARAPRRARPRVPAAPLAVAVGSINCDGIDQTQAANINEQQFFPPDADGAVGRFHFVQTTNVHVTVWDKEAADGGCPDLSVNPLLDIDLNSFFGYLPPTYPNATQLFDARVVHDDMFGRWVIIAEGFPEDSGVLGAPQVQFIAVSQSADATGDYFIFNFNTRTLLDCLICFWDFPQLGYDRQRIILTANIFKPNFTESHAVFMRKLDLYQGIGPLVCDFSGGSFTRPSWAPPKVVGSNNLTWLAEAAPSGSVLALARFSTGGQFCPPPPDFFFVPVPAYTVPISASQPGTAERLDTLDARFQNRSTQVGDGPLWNTHTTNDFGLPTPRLYRIRLFGPGSPVVDQTIDYFASDTSHDFNPSVTANFLSHVAVTWSSTDAGSGINAQVRVGAKTFAASSISQALVFQSSVPLTRNFDPRFGLQRWGDYSSITIDPTNGSLAWGSTRRSTTPMTPLVARGGRASSTPHPVTPGQCREQVERQQWSEVRQPPRSRRRGCETYRDKRLEVPLGDAPTFCTPAWWLPTQPGFDLTVTRQARAASERRLCRQRRDLYVHASNSSAGVCPAVRRLPSEVGYLLLDVLVGLGLLGFVLLAIYHLYGSTFVLSRDINSRLATQQDVRLALDRVAGALRETTSAVGRLRVYAAEAGCASGYEGCLGFVTARGSNCAGTFQLVDGAPNWQATLYLWRDTASNEVRLRCDPGSTFPVVTWPPPTLEPYVIIATRVVAATVTLQPADSLHPASIAIGLQAQTATSSPRRPATFFNQTIFLPQNR